jgi:hypothetical protein
MASVVVPYIRGTSHTFHLGKGCAPFLSYIQWTHFQRGFVQRGFDYTRENICDQLFAEREKLRFAIALPRHTKNATAVWKAKHGLAFACVFV